MYKIKFHDWDADPKEEFETRDEAEAVAYDIAGNYTHGELKIEIVEMNSDGNEINIWEMIIPNSEEAS